MQAESLGRAPAFAGGEPFGDMGEHLGNKVLIQRLSSTSCFRSECTGGNRCGNTVGDAQVLNGLFIFGKPQIDAAGQRGDIHGLAHGVFDVFSHIALVGRAGDADGDLNLAGSQIHLAHTLVEISQGQAAQAFCSVKFDFSIVSD